MRIFFAIALLGLLPCSLAAQRFAPGRLPMRGGSSHFHHSEGFGRSSNAVAFFYPLDWDYLSPPAYPDTSQPPNIVTQPPAVHTTAEPASPPAQPLLIELQGDRYVQVSGETIADEQMLNPRAATTNGKIRLQAAGPQMAVLVFRDGHKQNVSAYTIADGFLYVPSDYYAVGTWNQKIPVASLDLPETLRVNESRGVGFQLPTAPNEVIVGP